MVEIGVVAYAALVTLVLVGGLTTVGDFDVYTLLGGVVPGGSVETAEFT